MREVGLDLTAFVFVCPECLTWQVEGDVIARASLGGNAELGQAIGLAAWHHQQTHDIYTRAGVLIPVRLPEGIDA